MPVFILKFIGNLKIAWKFRIVALGFSLPLAILLYFLISEKNISINFAQKEIKGAQYLQTFVPLLYDIYNYDVLNQKSYANNPSGVQNLNNLGLKIGAKLNNVAIKYSDSTETFGEPKKLNRLSVLWHEYLKLSTGTGNTKQQKYDELVSELKLLITSIGDSSNLILDPDLDSYYLMDAALNKIPDEFNLLHQIVLLNYDNHKSINKERIILLSGMIKANNESLQNTIFSAYKNDAGNIINGNLHSLSYLNYKIIADLSSAFINSTETNEENLNSDSLFRKYDLANAGAFKLWQASINDLTKLLHERVTTLSNKKNAALISVGTVLFLTLLLFIIISENIINSVEELDGATRKVMNQEYDGAVNIRWNDELGSLGKRFNEMTKLLNDNIIKKTELLADEKLKDYTEQLRSLASHLQTIREEERTSIAREIHDELGQVLTVLKIQISLLSNKLRDDQQYLKDKITLVSCVIDSTVESVQRISSKLRPGILDDLGLIPALEWQAQDFQKSAGIICEYILPKKDIILEPEKSTAIFRIFQEALTNVARHAKADKITISLLDSDDKLILEIADNGKGITQGQIEGSKSLGILGMKERALIVGGTVKIEGSSKGTVVQVCVPLNS